MRDLTPLLWPQSVAVVGASASPAKAGGRLFRNLVEGGYPGRLYPVNPGADSVMERACHPSLAAVPGAVDLAFIALPRSAVRAALQECAARGVQAACIISAGFGEAGALGRTEQAELQEVAHAGRVLTIGPNTIGLVNAAAKLMGCYGPLPPWQDGSIALYAQTGIFAGVVMYQVMCQASQRLGVGKSVDVGNRVDVDEMDFLQFAADDPDTRVIGLHVEELRDPRGFLELANRVKATKPVIILKPGRTSPGARASVSHTGALATDERVLAPALRQRGLIRADDVEDFLGFLKAFSYLPVPTGRRLGLVTFSGALGVMAVDETVEAGLEPAEFAPGTVERLSRVLPAWQPAANPADALSGLDPTRFRDGFEEAFGAVLDDPQTDMVLGMVFASPEVAFPELRDVFAGLRARQPGKPLALVVYGGAERDWWLQQLEGLGVAVYPTTRAAIRAFRALADYAERRDRLYAAEP